MLRRLATSALLLVALPSFANVVGSDAQNFNPTTSGLDFVTVQSSSTLEPGIFNLGLFTNYAKNALPYYDTAANGGAKRNSSLTGGDLNFGLGFNSRWDGGLSLPFILDQQVDTDSSVGRYSSTGNTEVRVNTKYRLFGTQQHGFALIASANFNRIADNPYIGNGGGPIYNLEMAYKTMFGLTSWGLNLGYRWRNPGTPIANSGIEPLGDQYLASTALSYHFDSIDSKMVLEIFSAFPKQNQLKTATDRQYTVLEGLLGLKYDSSKHFSFHLGAGAGLVKGVSSPDYRMYAGINISFGTLGSGKHSVQSDPYAERYYRRPRVHKTSLPKPVPPPPPPPVPEAQPQPAPVAKPVPVPTPVPAPAPPPVNTLDQEAGDLEPAPEKEIPPAISTETVSNVKVFNRGTFKHIVLQNIEFVGNTMTLKPESKQYLLNQLSPALRELNRRKPIGTIVVEGHTDSLGKKDFNLMLSKARAQIVSALLRQHLGLKVPIQTTGAGSSKPIADNGNYQGRALNNRVEIKLFYKPSNR